MHFGNARGLTSLPGVARWLRRELMAFQPRVVQSMLWHANVLSAWALRGTTTPLLGGMRVSEPRRWRWPIERWAARRMQKMICVSDQVRDHAEAKQRIASDKLLVIPNGVSDSLLNRRSPRDVARDWSDLGLSPAACDSHKVLFVGRLEPQKGVLPLIESLPHWLNDQQPGDWRLIIMGRGSQANAMQASVQKLGLTERVAFLGWQPNSPEWMAQSDVLVLPAQYEGMPNVLLEAMAVGKPFVAFAVDGVAQLISPSDGYPDQLAKAQLATPRDWPMFETLLQRLMRAEELRRACGEANRAHVAQHFSLSQQLAKYLRLYEEL